jgi:ubiquinone/menaquinone biosynthesis C-methylase UbiE
MKMTTEQMRRLKDKGIVLSPYIEIGAERCQRSLVMENDIGAHGAAVDISFDILKSCDHYAGLFKKREPPVRVCCDVNILPFCSNSIPFIFCYETLHHFPEPSPVVLQIEKVLRPGGFFYFQEEPFKQVLHLPLYKSWKIYSKDTLKRGVLRKIIDRFFSESTCNERKYGVLENHDIPLRNWKDSLEPFG